MADDPLDDLGERWIGGRLGQPEHDDNDYARDFTWLGLSRVLPLEIAQSRLSTSWNGVKWSYLPSIEERLTLMGVRTVDSCHLPWYPEAINFANHLLHGPWGQVVRRRAVARAVLVRALETRIMWGPTCDWVTTCPDVDDCKRVWEAEQRWRVLTGMEL